MPFCIKADFRFGYYQGHDRYKFPEEYPSPARLQSAFMAAAYAVYEHEGMEGEPVDEHLSLPASFAEALRWFEDNPPDAIRLPETRSNVSSGIAAYRDRGLNNKGKRKNPGVVVVARTALAGPIEWWWSDEPEDTIVRRLEAFCCEVSYLGETDSPVRLCVCNDIELPQKVYVRADNQIVPDALAESFYVPSAGRSEALHHSYEERYAGRAPSAAGDKFKSSEDELSDNYITEYLNRVTYVASMQAGADRLPPWSTGFLVNVEPDSSPHVQWPPADNQKLGWAVATHRALVKCCGNDIPLSLTGRSGFSSQANNLSIQLIDRSMPVNGRLMISSTALLFMLPTDANGEEHRIIEKAIRRLHRVYSKELGAIRVSGKPVKVDLAHFWKPVPDDYVRLWKPAPVHTLDNRPPHRSSKSVAREWTLADSILVSVGYVFRHEIENRSPADPNETNAGKMERISHAVSGFGVTVAGEKLVYLQRPSKYVHHMNRGSRVSASTFLLHLGSLSDDTSVIALGQSRHLGGGLLVPVDLPKSIVSMDEVN